MDNAGYHYYEHGGNNYHEVLHKPLDTLIWRYHSAGSDFRDIQVGSENYCGHSSSWLVV